MATKNPYDQELLKRFASNVRRIRKERKMTMLELAYECDVEIGTISTVERAIVNCSLSTAYRIATALHVSLDQLLSKV